MTEPVRLAKRLAQLLPCSRREAELYIAGGWVRVNGEVVEEPQFRVTGDETIELDPKARAEPLPPATLLLHQPAGLDADAAAALLTPAARSPDDASGMRVLGSHFKRLDNPLPLQPGAVGLNVWSQDPRLLRKLRDDADRFEQEYVVGVAGELAPGGLERLQHGLRVEGRALPPAKVSWQSEHRLRFAVKDPRPGQIQVACAQVGLRVVAMKRIRIGRLPMAKLAPGQWRYLAPGERF
jgi:23S rRNA pseudouridine2604 synthase